MGTRLIATLLLLVALLPLGGCPHLTPPPSGIDGKEHATADGILQGLSSFLGARDAIAMSLGFLGVDMSWMQHPEACVSMEVIRAGADSGRRGMASNVRADGVVVMPGGTVQFERCQGPRGPVSLAPYLIIPGTVDQQLGILEAAKVHEKDPWGYAYACASLEQTRRIGVGALAAWDLGLDSYSWPEVEYDPEACRQVVVLRAMATRDTAL